MNSHCHIYHSDSFIRLLLVIMGLCTLWDVHAGTPELSDSNVCEEYIKTYYQTAIKQQKRYKIPASITLAQGLLESGAGQSYLALAGNNHFGIKCTNWNGESIFKDDDKKHECFRKYVNADESFEDHSLFLSNRSYYTPLFKLNATDYKSWATGLKKCGYATDPQYASKLIELIEKYGLHYFDTANETDPPVIAKKTTVTKKATSSTTAKKATATKATAKTATTKKAVAKKSSTAKKTTTKKKTSSTAKTSTKKATTAKKTTANKKKTTSSTQKK